jgi:hypothetical protein
MNAIVIAPIVFPLIIALITFALWKKSKLQELINLIGNFCLMIIGFLLLNKVLDSGIQVMQAGNWEAPFGITIVADTFSAVMAFITGVMAFSVSVYSISSMKGTDSPGKMRKKQFQFAYYPLLNIMYMGINGAFLTGDLFNMYVWFEVLLISSFVLLSLGGTKLQLEGTFKYVTINLISSAFFLVGTGLLYSITGTLNMAHLAEVIPSGRKQRTGYGNCYDVFNLFWHQSSSLPAFFLASNFIPYTPHKYCGYFRRDADKSRGLFSDQGIHAYIPHQRTLHPHNYFMDIRPDHVGGRSWSRFTIRHAPYSFLPYHQSDRIYDSWTGTFHTIGYSWFYILYYAPHYCKSQPVSGQWDRQQN